MRKEMAKVNYTKNRIRDVAIGKARFVLCLVLSLTFFGCKNEPEKVADIQSNEAINLRQVQVLMRGTVMMNSEFYDYNSDSKLDLFIGTAGHEDYPDDPKPIRMSGESYRRNLVEKKKPQQLSIHLNQSQPNESFQFGPSTGLDWVDRAGWPSHEQTIPPG